MGTATKCTAPVLLIPTHRNNPQRDLLYLRSTGKIHRFWGLLFSTTWSSTIASEQALRFPSSQSSSSYLHLLEQSTYGICYLKTICIYWVFPPLSLLGLEHGFSRSQDQFTILLGHLISNNHYLTPSSFAPTTTTTIWVTLDFSVNPVMSLVPWYDSIPFYFCILVFPP